MPDPMPASPAPDPATRRLDTLLFGPDAPSSGAAVLVDDRTVTWDELHALVAARADELTALRPGEVVAVSLPNGPEAIAAWFACWRRAGVVMPLNPRLTPGEQDHVLTAVPPRYVVRADATVQPDGEPRRFDPGVALVSFTSGTTGAPKPVPLRHASVLDLMDSVLATIRGGTKPGDGASAGPGGTARPGGIAGPGGTAGSAGSTGNGGSPGSAGPAAGTKPPPMPNLIPVSLSLWAGIYNVLFAFRVGAPVVLMPSFEPVAFAELVARHGIRSTVLPPAAMVMLADDERVTDLVPLRLVRSITAPLSPLQARRFRDRFGVTVLNGYGQTELGGEVIGWSAADGRAFGDRKLGSVGRPHPGVDVRVAAPADADGDAETADRAADDAGELWVRTRATTAAVAGGPDAIPPELAGRLDAEGYLRTGDIARIDGDGFVWIEGRVSDMVNRGGLKVFPAEVEEVLRLHPSVADAVVVGAPDDRLGEVPVAYVVPADGATVDAPELATHCREHLAPYKVPAQMTSIDEIPRNEIGKVVRARLPALPT